MRIFCFSFILVVVFLMLVCCCCTVSVSASKKMASCLWIVPRVLHLFLYCTTICIACPNSYCARRHIVIVRHCLAFIVVERLLIIYFLCVSCWFICLVTEWIFSRSGEVSHTGDGRLVRPVAQLTVRLGALMRQKGVPVGAWVCTEFTGGVCT